MTTTMAMLVTFLALIAPTKAALLPPGLYDAAGRLVYVGIEHSLPDPAQNDFFDPHSQRTGELRTEQGLRLRSGLLEERRTIDAAQGPLGVSLYYATEKPSATVILIHGNDPETREMGCIIPFFVLNGVNVISYDQRGVGDSTGNWFLNGPAQKANDVVAIYDAFRGDRHVDARRIGVWGFSNGGWTAPLLSLRRPIAFMLLKSAPTESLASNIDYEVEQEMSRHGEAAGAQEQAVTLWHAVEAALDGTGSWSDARRVYSVDAKQPWFRYSLMPDLGISFPPPPSTAAGLKRAITFDPTGTLSRVSVPTLALYGRLDRKVDALDSAAHLRQYLIRAGNRDVTVQVYADAGHPLTVSKNGYVPEDPERYVPGYPQIMITWLAQRGLVRRTP
jgi:pimeloyl-ACP methyl ester carboxylesterase